MDFISINAHAKINLAIDVLGKTEDGKFHELAMVMQTIFLHDKLFIKKVKTKDIRISSDCKWVPTNSNNLIYKAADLLIKRYGLNFGIFCELTKNIPVSAGLGGGSADCAATLVAMRELFNLPISDFELLAIGKELGADVPFCMVNNTALAEGIGEKLTILPNHPLTIVLLVRPQLKVSTAEVFKRFRQENVKARPNIAQMVENIKIADVPAIANGFCNVLESVTENLHPVIKTIKKDMRENHAQGVLMSGSGPSVFGYFETKAEAICAAKQIKKRSFAENTAFETILTSTHCQKNSFMTL